MKKKEFKSESKRLLELMINSIYTNKEIFLRELISNASDALDKLYFNMSTDASIKTKKEDLKILVDVNKDDRTITITDNGIGMDEASLEENLGTIAKSGSLAFKEANENSKDALDIIGQFGVGFYSAFMVSSSVEVISKSYKDKEAHLWKSDGVDGYTIESADKDEYGTIIRLHIKEDSEDEKYSKYLNVGQIKSLIKKYSDYIKYPIMMKEKDKYETINSMIPIWKKDKKDITDEEVNAFYKDKFYDYEDPIKSINYSAEGNASFKSLLFIPSHAPYDLYTKEYKKGLALYTSGVLIMDKCEELLPDHFSFVKGIVDTEDLSLNISRETLQTNKTVKVIASSIESKITKELKEMMDKDMPKYIEFFKTFGNQIKYGAYNNYGMDKDKVKDLIVFYSSNKKDFISLKEYVKDMKEGQTSIYYACGQNVSSVDSLPQLEVLKDKGYDILYLTDYVDEFAVQSLQEYEDKKFVNAQSDNMNVETDKEKEEINKINTDSKDMLEYMKKALNTSVDDVKFTNILKTHPVCLTSKGAVSTQMEKVINAMPTDEKISAQKVLEINSNHPIATKIKSLFETDKEALEKYTKVLYAQARLIDGMEVENPSEISELICDIISK